MSIGGYSAKVIRINLNYEKISEEIIEEAVLRKYVGGTGIAAKYLYEEVPPGTEWHDPANKLIFFCGPLGGTRVGGSGTFSVVTKGALTNGATSSQANGFFGAFLKFSGYDGIIMEGVARKPVYLYIHDGCGEMRDATHLVGKDTWETEDFIKKELGKRERELSVYSIGPAGENLVKFACIVGDRGHVASHNGVGAVMGSKKLKAIAVGRGKGSIKVADKETLSVLAKEMLKKATDPPDGVHIWGTLGSKSRAQARLLVATLPVKNYATNLFPPGEKLSAEYIRPLFKIKWHPCWACQFRHCHIYEVIDGPYKGFIGEEPEYEQGASWGSLIGQEDLMQIFLLSNEVDRLGMDTNESSWLIAWLMECYEKGLLTKKDLDGIELTWGNVAAVRAILKKIARREGIGDILAEGVRISAQHMGEAAESLAIYTKKGNTPRTHDHRSSWPMLIDTVTSDTGTDEDGAMVVRPGDVGLPIDANPCTHDVASTIVAKVRGKVPFQDSLGMCVFNNWGMPWNFLANLLRATTGWSFMEEEALMVSRRIVNLLRAFNIRHGLTADLDAPSAKYGSMPTDGPFKGISILPHWSEIVRSYYEQMGWDKDTGKPLPETLRGLGLDHIISDIW